jgi:hypothetical protein
MYARLVYETPWVAILFLDIEFPGDFRRHKKDSVEITIALHVIRYQCTHEQK